MAQPSSSHHGEREHRHRSSSHHHRTISSTTMLLVLSLVLAVLAVMLSLPSASSSESGGSGGGGVLGFFNPKRTQALIARESAVAVREAEVARREAELLAGAPGGVVPSPSAILCPACTSATVTITDVPPVQTIIKEIVKEDSLAPPGWVGPRTEELLDRELKIAERERDISKREENVNRREHDAARRESWIMEQLIALGNDAPQTVEDDYVYEPSPKRKLKYNELPPIVVSEVAYETQTKTVVQTQTVTVPPPANTRLAAFPTPEPANPSTTPSSPRTTAVEIFEEADDHRPKTVLRGPPKRVPARWFGNW